MLLALSAGDEAGYGAALEDLLDTCLRAAPAAAPPSGRAGRAGCCGGEAGAAAGGAGGRGGGAGRGAGGSGGSGQDAGAGCEGSQAERHGPVGWEQQRLLVQWRVSGGGGSDGDSGSCGEAEGLLEWSSDGGEGAPVGPPCGGGGSPAAGALPRAHVGERLGGATGGWPEECTGGAAEQQSRPHQQCLTHAAAATAGGCLDGLPPSSPLGAALPLPRRHRRQHDRSPAPPTARSRAALAARRAALRAAIDGWCRATVQPQPQSQQEGQQEVQGGAACAAAIGGGLGDAEGREAGGAGPCPASAAAAAAAAPSSAASFAALRPLLEAVLRQGEPAPLLDIRRNGSHTELQVASLTASALPPGWRLYCGAVITRVDGQPFRPVRRLKGEADLLLVDHEGCVQALVEVKTAKGNPYVALYEDVGKLLGLLRTVRGRTVTFRHAASQEPVTLEFGPRLRPIYVLGCGADPAAGAAAAAAAAHKPNPSPNPRARSAARTSEPHAASPAAAAAAAEPPPHAPHPHAAPDAAPPPVPSPPAAAAATRARPATSSSSSSPPPPSAPAEAPAALRSAVWKLLSMELGRQLASEGPGAWAGLQLAEVSRREVRLALSAPAAAPLARRVAAYFARLARCNVFTVHCSS